MPSCKLYSYALHYSIDLYQSAVFLQEPSCQDSFPFPGTVPHLSFISDISHCWESIYGYFWPAAHYAFQRTCFFSKDYPKAQSHIKVTETTETANMVSLVIVQKIKCKMWGSCFIYQSFKNLEATLGIAYKLLKLTRILSKESAQVCQKMLRAKWMCIVKRTVKETSLPWAQSHLG